MVDIKIDNRGKKWTEDEDKKLIEEYVTNKLDVNVIANNHGRSPVGIAARLKQKSIIKEQEDARGYDLEINNKYKEILNENKKEKEIDVIETLKELQKSNKEMGIKIDNLLNFLTKDKVENKLTETEIDELRKELKSYRLQKSQKYKCQPYLIFNNNSMEEIIEKLPAIKEELLKVKGIGNVTYEKYGEDLLGIVKKYINKENNKSESEEELNYEIVDEESEE